MPKTRVIVAALTAGVSAGPWDSSGDAANLASRRMSTAVQT